MDKCQNPVDKSVDNFSLIDKNVNIILTKMSNIINKENKYITTYVTMVDKTTGIFFTPAVQ